MSILSKSGSTSYHQALREGADANDHNRRVYRKQAGELKQNPYVPGTLEHRWWNEGYQYRDMANDG